MTVTGDREVGVWQASGSTYLGLAAAVTMAAGARGNVTFAVPAVERDTAALNHRMQAGHGTARFRDRRPPSRG